MDPNAAPPQPPPPRTSFELRLPAWVAEWLSDKSRPFPHVEERMRLAIELGLLNIQRGTGGPFGAAVFDLETHRLVAVGMNLVVPTHCSACHAEVVALTLAQQTLRTHDLGASGLSPCELVTSTEPCAMCLGAIPWSGVRQVVCGARDEDARQIGFDEGPKLPNWVEELEKRQIRVLRDVLRPEAVALLNAYAAAGGPIYNGRATGSQEAERRPDRGGNEASSLPQCDSLTGRGHRPKPSQ